MFMNKYNTLNTVRFISTHQIKCLLKKKKTQTNIKAHLRIFGRVFVQIFTSKNYISHHALTQTADKTVVLLFSFFFFPAELHKPKKPNDGGSSPEEAESNGEKRRSFSSVLESSSGGRGPAGPGPGSEPGPGPGPERQPDIGGQDQD